MEGGLLRAAFPAFEGKEFINGDSACRVAVSAWQQ
jgi:hypothetical protein